MIVVLRIRLATVLPTILAILSRLAATASFLVRRWGLRDCLAHVLLLAFATATSLVCVPIPEAATLAAPVLMRRPVLLLVLVLMLLGLRGVPIHRHLLIPC